MMTEPLDLEQIRERLRYSYDKWGHDVMERDIAGLVAEVLRLRTECHNWANLDRDTCAQLNELKAQAKLRAGG